MIRVHGTRAARIPDTLPLPPQVWRLLQLSTPPDIFLSHDWPTNIVAFGPKDQLLRRKPFFRRAA